MPISNSTLATSRFVERFAGALADAGWPRMSARIFALLMALPGGSATAAQLAERLSVGASAISNGAKMLRELGVVQTWRQSDRQIVYEVRHEAWIEATAGRDAELMKLERVLTDGAATLDAPAAERLRETADFFAFLRKELPSLVNRWRNQTDVP